jgi:polyhydroxyalkanoate synthase
VELVDLEIPIFAVGTERDHVSPWRSVYKLHLLTGAEISFPLTSGRHNSRIISEPGHAGRHYRFSTRSKDAPYLSPDTWLAQTPVRDGSWRPCWQQWLVAHSSETIWPPAFGDARSISRRPVQRDGGSVCHRNQCNSSQGGS